MGRYVLVCNFAALALVAVATGAALNRSSGSLTPTLAASGTLPGGTQLAVTIGAPADGALLLPGPVTVTGSASLGTDTPVADNALIYVLDVSGSTDASGGCGGDQNADTRIDQVIDCEIAAAKALNDQALTEGTVGDVGAVAFAATGQAADLAPAKGVPQQITGPATDADASGGPDIVQVLGSTYSNVGGIGGFHLFTDSSIDGNTTNYAAGLSAADAVAAASAKPHKIVAFMSDGDASAGVLADVLPQVPENVDVYTFAVGSGAACDEEVKAVPRPARSSRSRTRPEAPARRFPTSPTCRSSYRGSSRATSPG